MDRTKSNTRGYTVCEVWDPETTRKLQGPPAVALITESERAFRVCQNWSVYAYQDPEHTKTM